MFEIKGKYTTASVYADKLDSTCISQLHEMVNHVAFDQPVAIMPDAHAGKGSVIGFTMPLGEKLVPNVIGVDIGCGMTYANLGRGILGGVDFASLDRDIRDAIPFGFKIHSKQTLDRYPDYSFWGGANQAWIEFATAYEAKFGELVPKPHYCPEWFEKTVERIGCPPERAYNSLGTLGGGNHFIEFATDVVGNVWVIIHSGSRKFGESVCRYWQKRAVACRHEGRQQRIDDEVARLKAEGKHIDISKTISEIRAKEPRQIKGLEWLETLEDKFGYMHDMLFAQQYASYNRYQMLKQVEHILYIEEFAWQECVHNFIHPKDLVIRKGAIRAGDGESCLVPLNMAAGSLLGEGKGNPFWNCSAPHGAGRVMSRSKAKKKLRVEDFRQQMKDAGVWSSSIGRSTIDEAPGAYKPWQPVMGLVDEAVEISVRLRPVMNLKAK